MPKEHWQAAELTRNAALGFLLTVSDLRMGVQN